MISVVFECSGHMRCTNERCRMCSCDGTGDRDTNRQSKLSLNLSTAHLLSAKL
uniref:CRC domain-containing protein n=1 Tax=Ascaris lumbricoides TaxID=6252 RepID=A0A0M3IQK7_ASCLU